MSLVLIVAQFGYDVSATENKIIAIEGIYFANRSVFRTLASEFVLEVGDNSSGSIEFSHRMNCDFHFDEKNGRFEINSAKTEKVQNSKGLPHAPQLWLTNGDRTLRSKEQWAGEDGSSRWYDSHIVAGADVFRSNVLFTVCLGPWMTRTEIESFFRPNSSVPFKAVSATLVDKWEDRPCASIEYRYETPDGDLLQKIYFDLERGGLPLYWEERMRSSKGPNMSVRYDDIRMVPNAGWLPFLQIRQNGSTIRRITVTKLKANEQLPRSAFQVRFPVKTNIVNLADKVKINDADLFSFFSAMSPRNTVPISVGVGEVAANTEVSEVRWIPWYRDNRFLFGVVAVLAGVYFWRRCRGISQ